MAIRLYRALLTLYPRRVRETQGEPMLRLFRDQLRELRRQGRRPGPFVRRALRELVADVVAERFAWGRGPLARRRFWMTAFLADLRYGARLLMKNPGMTAVAVVTLALGIGANAAIFSLLDAVLLRPLPYPNPDEIVMIWEKRPQEGVFRNVVSPADYRDWAARQTVFSAIAAQAETSADLTGGAEPERAAAGLATAQFFDVLQTMPRLGRTFRADDEITGQHRVVILSHGIWLRRFGGDESMVGRTLPLSGVPHEVIGVLPESFRFPGDTIDLWLPLPLPGEQSRGSHFLNVIGRLKPGVTVDQARAAMDQIGAQLSAEYPQTNRVHGVHVVSLREDLQQPVRANLWMLGGAVAFVLLIACVNVSNMLLARAAARRRELAVRAAIGAGRARLAGQAITESLLLSALGTLAGLGIAALAIRALPALISAQQPLFGLDDVALNAKTVAFASIACVITGLLFGLLPAWQASHDDPTAGLKAGGRAVGGMRRRLRIGLVGLEIAVASLLLVGAGVALRSFAEVLSQPPGIVLENRLTFELALPRLKYADEAALRRASRALEERLEAIPGVRAVTSTAFLPMGGGDSRNGIVIEGRDVQEGDPPTRAHQRPVGVDYFETMGARIVRGRGFTPQDDERTTLVTVINQTAANRFWPGRDPIGTRVSRTASDQWFTVVGIVADIRHWGFDQPVNPEMYFPNLQAPQRFHSFVLVTDGEPARYASAARAAVKDVDPNLPLSKVLTMEQVAAESSSARRSTMVLLGAFAAVALILAAAGVYGVMAHLVAMRRGEIAIRMTLGATPRTVLGQTIREGLIVAAAGLAIGFAASAALIEVLRSVAFGIRPLDPLTYAGVAAVLGVATILACWVPARRAMRVDPAGVIRGG